MSKTGSYFNPELLGYVSTLTGDSGGAISPLAGNITLEGGANIETIGVAGSHKITFDLDDDIILTSVTADLFYTSDAVDGLTITGNTILADGSNADIDIDIEPKGNGVINTSYILATGTIGANELYTTTLATGLTLTDNEIRAVGSDTNVDISLVPKGTGAVLVNGSAAITGTLLVDTLYTSNTATGLTITDNTIVADGSDANIDVTITPKGTGVLSSTELTLTGKVNLPTTTADVGQITINSIPYFHAYGSSNVYIGGAGNFTEIGVGSCIGIGEDVLYSQTTGNKNIGIGYQALFDLQDGYSNVVVGRGAGSSITSGTQNTIYGSGALSLAEDAHDNIAIGINAAYTYQTTESRNIIIGHSGVVGDNDTIRIGNTHSLCYIAGIESVTPSGGVDRGVVIVNSIDQLGSTLTPTLTSVTADTFYTSDAADGLTITSDSITADGTNTNIDISLFPKGGGAVLVDGSVVAQGAIGGQPIYTTSLTKALSLSTNEVSATGTDANIDIKLTPKGTGIVLVTGGVLATGTVAAYGFYTNIDPAIGLVLTANEIGAAGTDANIDIKLTPKGTGVITGTELTLTTALAVGYGGTGLTAPTDHCVLVGSGAAAITPITAGTNGQVLLGSTNNDPVFSSVTEGTNIDITEGAGTLAVATTKSEINAQTGTTYQLAAGDAGKTITLTNAAAITLTVPANATVAFEIGTVISIGQGGAGTVTVAPAGGVTINSVGALTDLSGTYAMATLTKTDTNIWWLAGSLS
jgi:hypothetical protein